VPFAPEPKKARQRARRAGLHDPSRSALHQIALDRSVATLNKEDKRRANIVGIFPSEARISRLIGTVLVEQSDEWLRALTLRHMRHGGRRHHRLAKENGGSPGLQ
jgi:transposase-like protein